MDAITVEEWRAEAVRRFGEDPLLWRFVCPSCGHVAAVKDWKDAGAPDNTAAFSCVGRYTKARGEILGKEQPCNYAGGGMFRLNPIAVKGEEGTVTNVFAFDEVAPQ